MDEVKIPKFDWDRLDDGNAGHTEAEWGAQKRKPKIEGTIAWTGSEIDESYREEKNYE